jgi:hypothetical protein
MSDSEVKSLGHSPESLRRYMRGNGSYWREKVEWEEEHLREILQPEIFQPIIEKIEQYEAECKQQ